MGARYPFYLLADSRDGQIKEAEVTRTVPSSQPTHGNLRHGFVYRRCACIASGSIANNAEIDVIWDKWQQTLEPLREKLNTALGRVGARPPRVQPAALSPPAPEREQNHQRRHCPMFVARARRTARGARALPIRGKNGKSRAISLPNSVAADVRRLKLLPGEIRAS